jgi:hypothetical protein
MGLFGYLEGATLQNITLSDVDIISGSSTGSLAGYSSMSSSIINCSVSGTVIGGYETGGLIGQNLSSLVSNSYSTCDVQGVMPIGGLVGVNDNSTVTDCFARGSVNGEDMVGGLSGYTGMSNISNCYSTGAVTALMPTFGGLIGYEDGSMIMESFWDIETSGCVTSAGGIGLPTEIMKDPMTYMNWDFFTPVWNIDTLNSGYPYLAWSIPQEPVNSFAGGNGTELDPYQVETAEHLNKVRDHLDSYFIQIADIDLGVSPWNVGEGWVPLGNDMDYFTGGFNGDHNSIFNLMTNNPGGFSSSLFGEISGSTLENIQLDSVSISGADLCAGLAACVYNGSEITDCYTTGNVSSGGSQAGGLVAYLDNSSISNSFSTCNVNSSEYNGGLCGAVRVGSAISNCYAWGDVTGNYNSGGLIGYLENSTISNSYSKGVVSGISDIGGLIGNSLGSIVDSCYWDIDMSGQALSSGGTGKTTSEMKTDSTYYSWDLTNIWSRYDETNDSYPYFIWQGLPTPFGAPQNVVTEIIGGQIVLSWDRVQDTANYIVFVSENPYGSYSFLDFTPDTEYTLDITIAKMFFYITASDMKKKDLLAKIKKQVK